MFCRDLQLTSLYFGLLQKGLLIKGEVWRNTFSNVIVVTLVTQCLPSSFLCRNCAIFSSVLPEQLSRRAPHILLRQKFVRLTSNVQ